LLLWKEGSAYIFDPEMTANKMIFLTGPRQVVKPTFAKMWLESIGSEDTYFNWDDLSVMMEYKKIRSIFVMLLMKKSRINLYPSYLMR